MVESLVNRHVSMLHQQRLYRNTVLLIHLCQLFSANRCFLLLNRARHVNRFSGTLSIKQIKAQVRVFQNSRGGVNTVLQVKNAPVTSSYF